MSNKLKFIGLDTTYPTARGEKKRRIHLDGAASPLACETGVIAAQSLLPHYSNTHSYVHNSAQISTHALAWARQQILVSLGADPDIYTVVFTGSGCTAAINRIARGLAGARSHKNLVLASSMEHHANDLPHRQLNNEIVYIPLTGEGQDMGSIDLDRFQQLCEEHSEKLNYVAVSSVSNVTGIPNPIEEMTEIAHRYDALMLVDAAQSVAHTSTKLSVGKAQQCVDFFVFSGHKLYTPTAPGVLVAKKDVLHTMNGQDMGGGSVDTVTFQHFELSDELPYKDESGTTNIVGAYSLAKVFEALTDYGFENIQRRGEKLMNELYAGLDAIDGITIYGDSSASRFAALAFNHRDIDHGLLAAILNDYYSIAVRNECFCAHPYVSSLLKRELWELDIEGIEEDQQEAYINRKRGMVRASISLYNNEDDIESLISAVSEIAKNHREYSDLYRALNDGSYQHREFKLDWQALL